MDTNRIPKQALQYKPKGRKHIGRPRKRWRDQFHFEDTRNRKHAYSFMNMIDDGDDDDDDDDNFKVYIKIDIKKAPTCFGVITIIRERTN